MESTTHNFGRSAILTLLLILPGCGISTSWQTIEVENSLGEVWSEFNAAAVARGFRSDLGATDHGKRIYQSSWKPKPTGQLGRRGRVRLHGRIEPIVGDQGKVRIEFYVERQDVEELEKVLNPSEDDFSSDGQDTLEERYFGANLRARLQIEQEDRPVLEPGS